MWPRTPKAFAFKDWITVAVSLLAFSVSLGTAYLTLLRQTERVDALVVDVPQLSFEADAVKIHGAIAVTFANTGSRAVSVAKVFLRLIQKDTRKEEFSGCLIGESTDLLIGSDPFIIPAGQMLIQKWPVGGQRSGDLKADYQGANKTESQQRDANACVTLFTVTSRGYEFGTIWFGYYGSQNQVDKLPINSQRTQETIIDRVLPFGRWTN